MTREELLNQVKATVCGDRELGGHDILNIVRGLSRRFQIGSNDSVRC